MRPSYTAGTGQCRQRELQQGQAGGGVDDAQCRAQLGEILCGGFAAMLGNHGLLAIAGGAVAVENQAIDQGRSGSGVAGGFAESFWN